MNQNVDRGRKSRRAALRLKRSRYHSGRHPRATRHTGLGEAGLPTAGVDKALAENTALIEKQKENLMRLQADFENYRRRTRNEMKEMKLAAGAGLITELLPILDNFSRALEAPAKELEGFVDGVRMIRDMLIDQLVEAGLERIEAEGKPFDPNIHEAVAVDASGEHEENTIVNVLQEGYRVRGRLMRPAMVRVARSS